MSSVSGFSLQRGGRIVVNDLEGATALITGSGSPDGIGFATAKELGQMGATVVVTSTTERSFDRADELHALGISAHAFVADLTSAQQSEALVDFARSRTGSLEILVNNAGMTSVSAPMPTHDRIEHELEDWEAALGRNLTTAFNVTRLASRLMVEHRYGRIVNVASTSGYVNAFEFDAGYHAAKAGMIGLTRALAIQTASAGVTVNAVCPGWIATGSASDDELRHGRATPVGRSGTVDEIAHVIAFLAGPGASYITGQALVVDGGNSIAEVRG